MRNNGWDNINVWIIPATELQNVCIQNVCSQYCLYLITLLVISLLLIVRVSLWQLFWFSIQLFSFGINVLFCSYSEAELTHLFTYSLGMSALAIIVSLNCESFSLCEDFFGMSYLIKCLLFYIVNLLPYQGKKNEA